MQDCPQALACGHTLETWVGQASPLAPKSGLCFAYPVSRKWVGSFGIRPVFISGAQTRARCALYAGPSYGAVDIVLGRAFRESLTGHAQDCGP